VIWQTVSALATGAGTLVLAVATFWAVRSSNRSARIAEQALLAGLRPLLVQSRTSDPAQKALWSDRHAEHVDGGRAVVRAENGVIYLAMSLRNVGAGIALLHGWYPWPEAFVSGPHADPADFRRLTIDLYISPSDIGYWESAIRDPADPLHGTFAAVAAERQPFTIDLLYGDQEGGQRTITRLAVLPASSDDWYCQAGRHWNLDRPEPRTRPDPPPGPGPGQTPPDVRRAT
jgi:hypothetical protein